ncbi:palindromic element RPE1 domain-containing protein [Candidatus Tisiphia endosymbiont of Beris chalybata]|uniref:palindromic element RPE1 domain-containing protein n=1 Tax=Candidatus Tisiphia endosymbiont of Beris chalybata TaxID=3066262 RepID=UPI00312CAB3B
MSTLQERPQQIKFEGLEPYQRKESGANDAGIAGGIYKDENGKLSMVKCESDHSKNIAEFLGSQCFQALSPGSGAQVSLIAPQSISYKYYTEGGIQDDGSNIYVKSDFLENYSNDMYKDMDENMSDTTKPNDWLRKEGRPLNMGSRELLAKTLTNAFIELNYQDFEKIAPASLVTNDFDIHTGNIGVIRNPNNLTEPPRLVRIDFAASLNKLEDKIHPHSISRHLPLLGPTNHYREFPDFLKNNNLFADSLINTAKINLDPTIDKAFQELIRYYNNEALVNWARKAMPHKFHKVAAETITVEDIKTSFKDVMQKRQGSLEEYGVQIKLGLLNNAKSIDENQLKQLIRTHFSYFDTIISSNNKQKFKTRFREAYQFTNNLSQVLIKMITKLFYMIIKEQGQEEELHPKISHIAKKALPTSPTSIENAAAGNLPSLLTTQLKGKTIAQEVKTPLVAAKPISAAPLPPANAKIVNAKEDTSSQSISSIEGMKKTILPLQPNNIIQDRDIRPLSKFALSREFEGDEARKTAAYGRVCEDSSLDSLSQLPVEIEFRKRSIPLSNDFATGRDGAKPIDNKRALSNDACNFISEKYIIQDRESTITADHKGIKGVKESVSQSIFLGYKNDQEIDIIIEKLDKNLEEKNVSTKIELIKATLADESILPQQKIAILQEIAVLEDTRRNALIQISAADSPPPDVASLIADNVKFKRFIFTNISTYGADSKSNFAKEFATKRQHKTPIPLNVPPDSSLGLLPQSQAELECPKRPHPCINAGPSNDKNLSRSRTLTRRG